MNQQPNFYDFPVFDELTPADLAGKSLAQLMEINERLDRQIAQVDTFYYSNMTRTTDYDDEYRAARLPLEKSSGLMVQALMPYYLVESYRERAEIERVHQARASVAA